MVCASGGCEGEITMTKKEMEKGFKEIWALYRETDKRFKETDKRFKETDKKIENTLKVVGDLTGKWSKFVEGLIAPAVEKLFKARGIVVDKVYQRIKTHRNGSDMEIDILAVDGKYAVLVEAKSTLKIEDVQEHEERLDKFKYFFPEYTDRNVVGAVGGILIEEGAERYAYKKGMFVIAQSGEECVKIENDKGFKPRVSK